MYYIGRTMADMSPLEYNSPIYAGVSRIILFLAHTIGLLLPLFIIGLPIWLDTILIFLCQIPYLNIFACLGIWIWALIIVIATPVNWLSIVYYVLFGGAMAFLVIGFIIALIKCEIIYRR